MDDPRIEAEDMKQARGDYELAPREQWEHEKRRAAEVWPTQRLFHDTYEAYVADFDPEETQEDMGDWMQLMLANWNLRMGRERQKILAAARETQANPGTFFFDALKRNGIFKGIL